VVSLLRVGEVGGCDKRDLWRRIAEALLHVFRHKGRVLIVPLYFRVQSP